MRLGDGVGVFLSGRDPAALEGAPGFEKGEFLFGFVVTHCTIPPKESKAIQAILFGFAWICLARIRTCERAPFCGTRPGAYSTSSTATVRPDRR